jgi:hypothetical protein
MKKSIVFFLIMMTSYLSAEIDIAQLTSLLQSNKYEDQCNALSEIEKNSAVFKADKQLIKLLINNLEYDGINKKLFNSKPDTYVLLKISIIKELGVIGDFDVLKNLENILNDDPNLKIKEACIFAMGEIGDDDRYQTTRSLVKFYKVVEVKNIKDDWDFCSTSINCFYKLCQDKSIELIDQFELIGLFKIFLDKAVFSETVYNLAKKKLMSVMLTKS